MANYNLVINSKFKPFSFKELAEPYLMYKQEYDTQQAALGELQAKASVWENIANEQTDPLAFARYKTYADNLKTQADSLATNGLNPTSRQSLMNLKADYGSRITPIEQAYAAKQKQAEQQQQALLQDDSLLFDRDAASTSLDDYMLNPQLKYDAKSGNKITARVAAAAQNLAKEFQDNPDKMKEIAGGDFYEYVKKRGFTSEAVLAAIANLPNASPILKNIVDDTVASTGIANWGNKQALDAAYMYARQGLWNAIGQDEAQIVANWRKQQEMQQAFQAAENEKNRQFQKEQLKPIPMLGSDGQPNGDFYDPKTGVITDKEGNIKTDANGNPLVIKSNKGDTGDSSPEGKVVAEKRKEKTEQAYAGYSPEAIVADKASWGTDWVADFIGEDSTGAFNWGDFNRYTRDGGADASQPKRDEVSTVKWANVDESARKAIMEKAEKKAKSLGVSSFKFDPNDYNFYDATNDGTLLSLFHSLKGYYAVPKEQDPYISVVKQENYSAEIKKQLLDSGYINSAGKILKDFEVYSIPGTEKGSYVQYIGGS